MMKRPFWNSISTLKYCSSSACDVLREGNILKQHRIFSIHDITEYSKLTLDPNPLHFDLECARKAGFDDIPVPGVLVASLFPRIIASHFPGAVYAKQTLEFKTPVFVGDKILGEVQASSIRPMNQKFVVKFMTRCYKYDENVVINGQATAILPTLALKIAEESE